MDRAAVVARANDDGVSIAAFVALKPDQKRSIIAMKRHCTAYLPNYMVPDTIHLRQQLAVDVDRQGRLPATQGNDGGARAMNLNTLMRRVFCWKFVFFELLLPVLKILGPARCSTLLRGLGRAQARFWPGRKARLIAALRHVEQGLGLDRPIDALWPELAANMASSLARDYPLDIRSDTAALDCFDVHGEEQLRHVLHAGNGVILVGSHMGAYIPCLHWLFRKGLPIRALVQRPRHVSRTLDRMFDAGARPLFPGRSVPPPPAPGSGCDRAHDPGPGRSPVGDGHLPVR